MYMKTKKIIEKWYQLLRFPKEYDDAFYAALETIEVPEDASLASYDLKCQDGKRNLLFFLYFCEDLKNRYEEKGLPEEILMDTLNDVVVWTETWSGVKGELFLGELGWLSNHFSMRLFRLGRLQYAFGRIDQDVPAMGVVKGQNIMEVHIPAIGRFPKEMCAASVEKAKAFFAQYYPDYEFHHFTCHSWLLDPTLKTLLPAGSNILDFQALFMHVRDDESDAILRYVFRWGCTRADIDALVCTSSFSERVMAYTKAGGKFNESLGIFRK